MSEIRRSTDEVRGIGSSGSNSSAGTTPTHSPAENKTMDVAKRQGLADTEKNISSSKSLKGRASTSKTSIQKFNYKVLGFFGIQTKSAKASHNALEDDALAAITKGIQKIEFGLKPKLDKLKTAKDTVKGLQDKAGLENKLNHNEVARFNDAQNTIRTLEKDLEPSQLALDKLKAKHHVRSLIKEKEADVADLKAAIKYLAIPLKTRNEKNSKQDPEFSAKTDQYLKLMDQFPKHIEYMPNTLIPTGINLKKALSETQKEINGLKKTLSKLEKS